MRRPAVLRRGGGSVVGGERLPGDSRVHMVMKPMNSAAVKIMSTSESCWAAVTGRMPAAARGSWTARSRMRLTTSIPARVWLR